MLFFETDSNFNGSRKVGEEICRAILGGTQSSQRDEIFLEAVHHPTPSSILHPFVRSLGTYLPTYLVLEDVCLSPI